MGEPPLVGPLVDDKSIFHVIPSVGYHSHNGIGTEGEIVKVPPTRGISLFVCLFVYLCVCLCICLFVCLLSVFLSVCLSVCLFVYLFVCWLMQCLRTYLSNESGRTRGVCGISSL
eukprot:sb/3476802/